jgi:small-conductance mechanosensitive channel
MVLSSFVSWIDISQISIFPILFMILLAEEFTRTQLAKSEKEAKRLMLGTIFLAVVGAVTMNFTWIQNVALNYPDLLVILVLVINLLVGNYTGIRWMEISRFKKAIREKLDRK